MRGKTDKKSSEICLESLTFEYLDEWGDLIQPFLVRQNLTKIYGAFSHDVTPAILVFKNEQTAAMLLYQTKPPRMEVHFHANFSFCAMKLTWPLVTWVKTLYTNKYK